MKSRIFLFFLFFLAFNSFASSQNNVNSLELPTEWRFQTGDNPEFSKPDFDDHNWKNISEIGRAHV